MSMVEPVGGFEQFVKFVTDATGLERILRWLQALAQVLIFVAPARAAALYTVSSLSSVACTLSPAWCSSSTSGQSAAAGYPALLSVEVLQRLRASCALTRRYFRLFRFFEAFGAAWTLYTSFVASPAGKTAKSLETWLAISSRSFNGMYLLLESLTFIEGLGVEGLDGPWGTERAAMLRVEANRFWFFSLLCGIIVGGLRLVGLYRAQNRVSDSKSEKKGIDEKGSDSAVATELENRKKKEKKDEARKILRRLTADVLDISVPGSVVGWSPLSPGPIGVLMLGSTALTGLEVWDRCGKELEDSRGAWAI
ncbi:peroxisomal biogenesis factor 11-domain-containing protein [Lasiosphaeria miniovina]|uniref:Peroxisomal biogenesis factor 11-domain-containing protein n=1 Tax=Lasiosphaeria miniovina TaxID=1954250 RepID=A0AA40A5C7_9PEZI|nr:peroxisomal biogenesis factor 11-domain-containing protein [Lasiosphaeria miniovina]KAK0709631.1 peroxisomal biogenesis factor 11-domain-containing protein [Lasiosphaeria miniovina]